MDCPLSDVPYVGKIWGIGGIDKHEQLSGPYGSQENKLLKACI
jgi:hypothetical protein